MLSKEPGCDAYVDLISASRSAEPITTRWLWHQTNEPDLLMLALSGFGSWTRGQRTGDAEPVIVPYLMIWHHLRELEPPC